MGGGITCAFYWEAEGPDGAMRWNRRYLHEDGFLTVTWVGSYRGHKQEFSHRTMLNTRQAVGMLYRAFRNFVESPEYDPLRYEKIKAGDGFCLVLQDAGLEELTAALVVKEADAARRLLLSIGDAMYGRIYAGSALHHTLEHYLNAASLREIADEESEHWLCKEWGSLNRQQRVSFLCEQLYTCPYMLGGFGSNLRSMRSRLVEEWLARPDLAPVQPHDS